MKIMLMKRLNFLESLQKNNMRFLITLLLLISCLRGQDITLSQEEMLNIANNIKELQADSLRLAESLSICEDLVKKMDEQAHLDSLLLNAKDSQINLLKARDEMNEKMVKLVEPKWYENTYIWLGIGFILGKI